MSEYRWGYLLVLVFSVTGCAHAPPAWYQPSAKTQPNAEGVVLTSGASTVRSRTLAMSAATARAKSAAMRSLRCYRVTGRVVQQVKRGDTLYVQWAGRCVNFDHLEVPVGGPAWIGDYFRGKRGPDGRMWAVGKAMMEPGTDATVAKAQAEARARTRIASALGCPELTSSIRETYQKAPEYFVLMTADCASVPASQPEAEDAPPED